MEKQFEHEWQTQLDDGSTIFRTCAWSPPGCHPTSCGVEITVKDGKIEALLTPGTTPAPTEEPAEPVATAEADTTEADTTAE